MHCDRHEPIGFGDHLSPRDFLAGADDGLRRFTEMLTQWNDQFRRKWKPADSEVARVLLHLRRVDAVPERIILRKMQNRR